MALSTRQSIVRRTALGLAVSMVIAYPMAAQALGLGELHSSSQLNQRLNAQIDLLSTNPAEARQLQVRLASPDVFSRVGIDRPAFLNSLTFTPTVENGKPVIRVTSSAPITEPFLNFLLEVSWPQGQLLKEYTVLLDPPVLMNTGSAATENAAAVRAEPRSSGVVQRNQDAERQRAQQQRAQQQRAQQLQVQRQQAQQQTLNQQQQTEEARRRAAQQQFEDQARAVMNDSDPQSALARSSTSSIYRVKRGDTVSRIASRLRYRGVSNNQMMLALFRANPQAFSQSNINNLKTGATLNKPAKSDVVSSTSLESKRIIRQHYAQWKKYREGLASSTVAQQPSSPQPAGANTSNVGTASDNQNANLTVAGSDAKSPASNSVTGIGTAEIQKQLTLAQEAIASSKSENAELSSRVGKLEAIIRKKDRLISLKNNKLADLEARLSGVDEPTDIATQVGNQEEENDSRIIRGGVAESPAEVGVKADGVDNQGSEGQQIVSNPVVGDATDRLAIATTDPEPVDEDIKSPFAGEDEEKSKGGILDLLSSPLVAMIGGGGLLALLLGWFLMRRSSMRPEADDSAFLEETDGADLFDEKDASLETDLDDFTNQPSVSTEAADVENLFSDSDDGSGSDSMDSILSSDISSEEDDVLQEVDVYIVYGLHEQAEDELNKAIEKNPAKMEYRYKLLENYKAAGDAESFVSSSKDFLKAEGNNKEALWDKVVVWGKEIAPENELFSSSSLKNAMGMAAGAVGLGAAATAATEAFKGDDTHVVNDPSTTDGFADIVLPELDDVSDSDISKLDGEFDLSADLDLDDVGDDFGLDALSDKDFDLDFDKDLTTDDLTGDSNILDFGLPDAVEENDITGVDLDIDTKDVDKLLPKGSGYLSSDVDNTPDDSDDGLGDALSFLDISDDDDVQDAHIGTKLDLARAYLDMGDVEGARHTLEEVVIEGNDDQKKEAEELLQQTG